MVWEKYQGSNGPTGETYLRLPVHTIDVEWRGVTRTLRVTWNDLWGWYTVDQPFLAQYKTGKKLYPTNTHIRPKECGGFRVCMNTLRLDRPLRIVAWNDAVQEPLITARRGYEQYHQEASTDD